MPRISEAQRRMAAARDAVAALAEIRLPNRGNAAIPLAELRPGGVVINSPTGATFIQESNALRLGRWLVEMFEEK